MKIKLPKSNKFRILVFVGVFAVIGTAIIIYTRAATSSVSIEAENGQLAGGATAFGDTSASNSAGVLFGSTGSTKDYTIKALSRSLPAAEASGMIASKQYPGVFWWHRDGGPATADKPRDALYAIKLDANGIPQPVRGSDYSPFYMISGAPNTNWEDIAIDASNNIWIGDIGANTCGGPQDIYRIPEPNPSSTATTAPVAHFTFIFPDPPSGCTTWNSEAMFWLDGKLYIFAKTTNSPVYRIDLPSGNSGQANLVRLGQLAGGVSNISVSSLSSDRKRLLIAGHQNMFVFQTSSALSGDALVKDIISRAPVWKAPFDCNCNLSASVEGGTFVNGSYDVAFVAEGRQIYYGKPREYGDI